MNYFSWLASRRMHDHGTPHIDRLLLVVPRDFSRAVHEPCRSAFVTFGTKRVSALLILMEGGPRCLQTRGDARSAAVIRAERSPSRFGSVKGLVKESIPSMYNILSMYILSSLPSTASPRSPAQANSLPQTKPALATTRCGSTTNSRTLNNC